MERVHTKNNAFTYKKDYPKRLKLEGTKEGDFYNQLALAYLGETLWYQMKNGGFRGSILEDDQFIMAEFLDDKLETYDPYTKEIAIDEKIKPVHANANIDTDVVLEEKD